MPGTDLRDPAPAANIHPTSRLTAHKSLPRKPKGPPPNHAAILTSTTDSPTLFQMPRSPSPRYSAGHPLSAASITTQASYSSLPPTPPSNKSEGNALNGTRLGMSFLEDASGVSTPVNLRNPPTPDITPPRGQTRYSSLHSNSAHSHHSPRTSSFKTAREDQWSSDDDTQRFHSGAPDDEDDPGTTTPKAAPRGLESSQGTVRRRKRSPRRKLHDDDFGTFDGKWIDGSRDLRQPAGRECKDNLTKNVPGKPTRPMRLHHPSSFDQTEHGHTLQRNDRNENPSQDSTLRERVQQSRKDTDRTSTERFAEEISWPSMVDEVLLEMSPDALDTRRFSAISSTSTIVEALVVVDETSSRRRRVLRHKGKNAELRSLNLSPPTSSRPVSMSDHHHQLVHRTSQIPSRRSSYPTNDNAITGYSNKHPRQERYETIPVIVVPERTSSLKSRSARSSIYSRGTHSVTSASQQPRPAAPEGSLGYFDVPPRRKRTVSESASSVARLEGRRGRDYAPVIPPRSSSLSAPTSRNASRTTSLTSASVQSRIEARPAGAVGLAPAAPITSGATRSRPLENEATLNDAETEKASKYLLTPVISPFSIQSGNSSTPEPLEVSEATAVNIYPHQNKSLLVVRQHSRPNSQEYENMSISTRVPNTPPTLSQELHLMDSPLKNPRVPPKPPAFQVIPPTPSNLTPSDEIDRRLGDDERPAATERLRRGGALSLVRRALSNRRYSEGFTSPFARWKAIDTTTKPNVDRKDAKLSPFWLPRGFWDDVELDDEDIEDEFLERGRSELLEAPRLGRRITYPPAPLDQHDLRDIVALTRRQTLGDPNTSSHRKRRRIHPMPGVSVQIEYLGFKGVSQRLREMRTARLERTKERERNKMKGRISPPKAIELNVI